MLLNKKYGTRAIRMSGLVLAALLALLYLSVGALGATVRTPEASGKTVYSGNSVSIDASNTAQGYIMVRYTGSVGKIKLQITGPDKVTYTYTLGKGGGYETFPLTAGNGSYTANVLENISGTQYAQAYGKSFSVSLENDLLPYLYPSQYVNYSASSKTVAVGDQLAQGAADQLSIVSNVYNYVISHISYDDNKAAAVSAGKMTGYLPNVDTALATGKGICFDYAAVMATMLRTQGIPTRMEIGWAGDIYHAWVSVHINGIGWINNLIQFDGKTWKLMDPTFASNGNQSADIMQFINNQGNYSIKFKY